jgi:membrane fusion protein YbhG
MTMKKLIPILLILALVSGAAYHHFSKDSNGDDGLYSGVVEATEVAIAAEIPGRVLEISVNEGDQAEKDQVVVRIDSSSLEAQLKQAKAAKTAASGQYSAVNAGVKNLQTNVVRSENLHTAGSISEQQLDSVTTQKDVLKAQRTAAWGQIQQADATAEYVQIQIDKAEVKAPISGTVLEKNIEVGEMAMPGSPVLKLADLKNPWVRIYIPETELGKVKLGDKASVFSDSYPGKAYPGKVVFIAGEAEFTPKNIQTREERVRLVYAVKVALENPDGELKIGMPVDAELAE